MTERIFEAFVRALQLFVPPTVTVTVLLLAGMEVFGRPPPPPQVVVVPAAESCPEPVEPAPSCEPTPQPAPVRGPTTVNVFVDTTPVGEWLGVVDVRRSELDELLQSSSSLASSTRILPYEVDGRVVGFRLYGIRHDSLLGAAGLRNGDTVNEINGRPMTSPDTALEAYASLRRASHIDVRLTRRGRPARLLVIVHDPW